jgi:preprotein translocase subunit SecD
MMTRIVLVFAALLVLLILVGGVIAAWSITTNSLALPGEKILTICAAPHASESELSQAKSVVKGRLDSLGIIHTAVTGGGGQCLRVGIQASATQKAEAALLPSGIVAITDGGNVPLPPGHRVKLVCPPTLPRCAPRAAVGVTRIRATPPILQVVVPGSEFQAGSASVGVDPNSSGPILNYSLTQAGTQRWCRYTTNSVSAYSAIVMDDKVVIDPQIQQAICQGQTQIAFGQGGTMDEAKRVASYLNSGAYPAGIHFRLDHQ